MPKDKEAHRQRERERYNAQTGEEKERRAAQMRKVSAKREKTRRDKLHSMALELQKLRKENEELKTQLSHWLPNYHSIIRKFNRYPTLHVNNITEHHPTCPRYEGYQGLQRRTTMTRTNRNILFSVIIPLYDETPFFLYTGSHLNKGISSVMKNDREYHRESRVDMWIEPGFILLFDGNLVHGGGISKTRNPRIFATFGTHFSAIEPRNYIANCRQCEIGCLTCNRLERIKQDVTGPNILEHVHSPECTSLTRHGFVVIRTDQSHMPQTTTDSYNSEVQSLNEGEKLNGIQFTPMGQSSTSNVDNEGSRNRLATDTNKKAHLSGIDTYLTQHYSKPICDHLKSKLGLEYGLSDYTILLNDSQGATEQLPHMDHSLICNCVQR